ncbi:Putative retroelement [Phytophthora palmivora]|uniref:Retroelement n=1 Tax=Phytophthora palmivora TaxID=4796 RepID=A0A2P4YK54_9STRA|nr:Putative retroelement [Phytophthora palmivora]
MGHGKALTNQKYWWVIGLHDDGISLREISRKTGRSRTRIKKAVTTGRGPQVDSASEVARAGRRPALIEREVWQLVRAAATGEKFAAELKTDLGIKASVRAVQRVLKRVDHLVYTKMDRTLPPTASHKSARISWAEEHILNPGISKYTIFSDEKKFNLDGPDGFKYYWRDIRQPPQSYIRRQNGEGSVMVWGVFSAAGKSKLAILRGRQNSEDYIYTLSEYMLPFAHANYGIDFVFQQDNASIHASRETTHFLQEMQVNTMVWPVRSPDCNPIENLWSAMAARVYAHGRQYRTVDQLEAAILNAWAATEETYLQKLVDSMPRRCLAVIKAKGALTKGMFHPRAGQTKINCTV